MNYFFGVGKDKKLHLVNPKNYNQGQYLRSKNHQALPRSRKLQHQNTAVDPWLTWNDLFGHSPVVVEKIVTPTSQQDPTLPPSSSVRLPSQGRLNVKQPKPGSGLVQRKNPNRKLSQSQKVSNIKQSFTSQITQNQSQKHQVEAQPDWIEVTATSIGYEQHFLEKILVWLDRTMLWLEEILVKAVKWLKNLWRGK